MYPQHRCHKPWFQEAQEAQAEWGGPGAELLCTDTAGETVMRGEQGVWQHLGPFSHCEWGCGLGVVWEGKVRGTGPHQFHCGGFEVAGHGGNTARVKCGWERTAMHWHSPRSYSIVRCGVAHKPLSYHEWGCSLAAVREGNRAVLLTMWWVWSVLKWSPRVAATHVGAQDIGGGGFT